MAIIAKEESAPIELVPEDTHVGRCVMLVDIGTHQTDYGPKRQIVIGWELPEVLREFDGLAEPAMLSKFYTLSLSEKANLRRDLEQWRGVAFTAAELEGFDLERLIGVPAMVSVIHKTSGGDKRATIAGLTKVHASVDVPTQQIASRVYSVADPDATAFDALPTWVQNQVKQSAEWQAIDQAVDDLPEAAIDTDADGIPF